MKEHTTSKENELILKLIQNHTSGIPFQGIKNELPLVISERTLKRRLSELVASGMLIRVGIGRGVKYVSSAKNIIQEPDKDLDEFAYLNISDESRKVIQYVQQPLIARKPVPYNRDFLDSYIPTETAYLSESIRKHLQKIGAQDGTHPAGTFARKILDRLLIDLSWNSSRLEGNTYSLLETERLIQFGEAAENKNKIEAQMILNHKSAIEFLVEGKEEIGFNRYSILNLHALLSDGLLGNQAACGRLRSIAVGIGSSAFMPAEIPQLIDECFSKILSFASVITNPFEQAFFVMVHLPYLQPFEDVNKRTSRLAANIPLIQNNFAPLSFIDVPERSYIDGTLGVYELNNISLLRDVFIWAYERSAYKYAAIRENLVAPDPFRNQYKKQLTEIVRLVILNNLNKAKATLFIQNWVKNNIKAQDQVRVVAAVETELLSLHEGNIARFQIKPQQFNLWIKSWV